MPFIRFHPKFKIKGLGVLLDIEGGSYSVMRGGIYIISERDLKILDEKSIKYELLGRGVLNLAELDGKEKKPKSQPTRKKAVAK